MVTVKVSKKHAAGNLKDKRAELKRAREEFVKKNETELRGFFKYKTGIFDRDMIHDALYEFYYRIMKSESLLFFGELDKGSVYGIVDENGKVVVDTEVKTASFETYITNQLCWVMPRQARQRYRNRNVPLSDAYRKKYSCEESGEESTKATIDYEVLSSVSPMASRAWAVEEDVFDRVSAGHATYKVSSAYEASQFDTGCDPAMSGYIADFKAYVCHTESPQMAEKMITYLEYKLKGCKGVMIAPLLKSTRKNFSGRVGVSNNMVKVIRQGLQKKFLKWQELTEVESWTAN